MSNKIADLIISRAYYSDSTIGRITSPHFKKYIASLELPYLGNQKEISSVEEGEYKYWFAWSNQAQREVIWLEDKNDRTLIQIHPGNYTRQILGCILPGFGVRDIDKDGVPDVISSSDALDFLMGKIPNTGIVRIRNSSQIGLGIWKLI